MSRRHRAEKREVIPDAKYGDLVLTKFMNSLMNDGMKSAAESIVYGDFDIVQAKTKHDQEGHQSDHIDRSQIATLRNPGAKDEPEQQSDKQKDGWRRKPRHEQICAGGGETADDIAHDKLVGRAVAGNQWLP